MFMICVWCLSGLSPRNPHVPQAQDCHTVILKLPRLTVLEYTLLEVAEVSHNMKEQSNSNL